MAVSNNKNTHKHLNPKMKSNFAKMDDGYALCNSAYSNLVTKFNPNDPAYKGYNQTKAPTPKNTTYSGNASNYPSLPQQHGLPSNPAPPAPPQQNKEITIITTIPPVNVPGLTPLINNNPVGGDVARLGDTTGGGNPGDGTAATDTAAGDATTSTGMSTGMKWLLVAGVVVTGYFLLK